MATVPVIRTFVAGEVVLASYFNTNINGPISFLLAPPLFRGRQTSAQSLTSGTFAAVTLDAEDVDSANGHSTSSNTSRYTGQYAGWYGVSGGAGFAFNATGNRALDLRVNGAVVNGTQSNIATLTASSSTAQPVIATEFVFLNVNDYVELFAFQSSGGSLNTAVTTDQQSRMNAIWQSN